MKCDQKGCEAEAITVFFWPVAAPKPGVPPGSAACAAHAIKAYAIAEVMGFHLVTNPAYLEVLEAHRAKEVQDYAKEKAEKNT